MNGIFGEGFPYTNFHDLNMDWIIKIAKDFLDQYTHLQETIENGETAIENLTDEELTALANKADELTDLLDQWYTTHSEDIAGELATAITDFDAHALQKATETIATIPDNYTDLFNASIKVHDAIVSPDNYETVLPDADNVVLNSVYVIVPTANAKPANLPQDIVLQSYGILVTIAVDSPTPVNGSRQFYIDDNGEQFCRTKTANGWTSWIKLLDRTYAIRTTFNNSISDLNSMPINSIQTFVPTSGTHPSNLPSVNMTYGDYYTIKTVCIISNSDQVGGTMQELYNSRGMFWFRYKTSASTWTSWFTSTGNYIIENTISSALTDLNSAPRNSVITFVPTSGTHPDNMPTENLSYNDYYTLRTTSIVNAQYNVDVGGCLQELFNSRGVSWYRYKTSASSWSQWFSVSPSYENVFYINNNLDDLNNISTPCIITFVPTSGTHPDNLPSMGLTYNDYYTVRTTINRNANNIVVGGGLQELFNSRGKRWTRYRTTASAWSSWILEDDYPTFIVDKNGNGDFTSFSQAVVYARNYNKSIIKVNAGNYDLIDELDDIYDGYFTNYDPDETSHYPDNRGLAIGWGMKIIFSADAKLTCNWGTPDDAVNTSFSPLYAFNSDFELIGCNIECANVRYCVHDDPAPDTLKQARWYHKYESCNFLIDNSASSLVFRGCIGGGFGKQSTIEVLNCIFKSIGVADNIKIVNWHNTSVSDAKSSLVISGCYFITGTCGASYYGTTTKKSTALITNNSVKSVPTLTAETQDSAVINIDFMEFNNIDR